MGESYLRRKLFSRMRRAKTQTSISSSSSPPSSSAQKHDVDRVNEDNEQEEQQQHQRKRMPTNSASTPQLMMIRQESFETAASEATATAADDPCCSLQAGVRGNCDASESAIGPPTDANSSVPAPTSASTTTATATATPAGGPSIAAAVAVDSALAVPTPPSTRGSGRDNNNNKAPEPSRGKLKSASRAIQFFRRTASSLTSSTSSSRLVGVSRQDTGDSARSQLSANNRPVSSASSHVLGFTSTIGNNNASSNNNTSAPNSSGRNGTSNTKEMLPQFIVPKLNALRLPLVCLIKSLDGELMREVFVHRYELGQYLIESLKVSVGADDCKYFGLKMAKSFEDQEDLKNPWLDLNESVCKQIKNNKVASSLLLQCSGNASGNNNNNNNNYSSSNNNNSNTTGSASFIGVSSNSARSIEFYLRIKFYPPNLARVHDAFLRNYLWLQLRRDLRLGKLTSSMNNLTLLMGCVLQFEFGDHKPELMERIPELSILPNQDLIEEQASELWRTRLRGLKRHQAQMQFLRAAVILETYGFDYWPVRDHQRQRAYLLGFNYAGIKTIRNGRIAHHFRWHSLSKISYERRMIIFHIYPAENSKRKQILGFKCLSNEDCQNLYMRLLEQKYFFTVDLAYFDKSIRRPSCLYASPTNNCSDTLDETTPDSANTSSSSQATATNYCDHKLLDQQAAQLISAHTESSQSALARYQRPPNANNNCHYYSEHDEQVQAAGSSFSAASSIEQLRSTRQNAGFSSPSAAAPPSQEKQQLARDNVANSGRVCSASCACSQCYAPTTNIISSNGLNSSMPKQLQLQGRRAAPTNRVASESRAADLRGQQQQQAPWSNRANRLHRQQSTMEPVSSSSSAGDLSEDEEDAEEEEDKEGKLEEAHERQPSQRSRGGTNHSSCDSGGGGGGQGQRRHAHNHHHHRRHHQTETELRANESAQANTLDTLFVTIAALASNAIDAASGHWSTATESLLASCRQRLAQMAEPLEESYETTTAAAMLQQQQQQQREVHLAPMTSAQESESENHDNEIGMDDSEHNQYNQQEQQPQWCTANICSFSSLIRLCLVILVVNCLLRATNNFWTTLIETLTFSRYSPDATLKSGSTEQQIIDDDL